MKHVLGLFIFAIAILSSCKETNNLEDCIDQRIATFEMETLCPNGSMVLQYLFQGGTVYVFQEGNCGADMQDEVTDNSCKTLGYLGGIVGNTQINGEDFSNAQFMDTLWVQ